MLGMSSDDDSFPDDLTGLFWTRLVEMPDPERWGYEVVNHQNDDVIVEGLSVSPAQAARFVQGFGHRRPRSNRREWRPKSDLSREPR
jgi:hypothetical protein